MLTLHATHEAYHANDDRRPAYVVYFYGKTTLFSNTPAITGLGGRELKAYVKDIKGGNQTITPEEGQSQISGITVSILDKNLREGSDVIEWDAGIEWDSGIEWGGNEEAKSWDFTNFLMADDYQLQHHLCIIYAGYEGMTWATMANIFTGYVSKIKLWSDGLGYDITVSDPKRMLQRKIFRGSETTPVILKGNPLTILLRILTSTGDGTNGDYDNLDEENGVGITSGYINTTHIEEVRDTWYNGVRFEFDIRKRITASKFIEDEICKPSNLYPIIRADGSFDVIPFKPSLPINPSNVQDFDEDVIVDWEWDQNLQGLVNECEFSYDYDADAQEFDTIDYYADGTSITNRGPGKKSIEIKSRGIQTAAGGAEFVSRRKTRIFQRYADPPPPKLKVKTRFSNFLSEIGDIVPLTHSRIPNLLDQQRGVEDILMEVLNRNVDWEKGLCEFELLYTTWSGKRYAAISPASTVLSGSSNTVFTLETDEGDKWTSGWVIDIFRKNMVAVATGLTISDVTGDQITVSSSIGATPAAGWIITFSAYDSCAAYQQRYAFGADGSNEVGSGNDDPYYIC